MELRLQFERLLAHDRWANGEALASVEALAAPPEKARYTLGHLMGAETCWLHRMRFGVEPPDIEDWEGRNVAGLRRGWGEEFPGLWSAFLKDATLSNPSRTFSYVNYLGETHTARVEDVLLTLMLHGAYHRGQVASQVRAAGGVPAVTDFLHATRTGAVA